MLIAERLKHTSLNKLKTSAAIMPRMFFVRLATCKLNLSKHKNCGCRLLLTLCSQMAKKKGIKRIPAVRLRRA